ncbi:histidine acid phosphatase [Grosmannia clavigera kw1407]|uniref:3-phytase n=1 Tax=Grosmannia clavigera (strain kw1407 / UAMH 11150) TaxID=655863 RepID=F0XGZ9_GROCL|nr:histidine acid phosphatase [Grosmannia clavigera kw1407]EFX03212.1 histidine acid phosphatase [Grosmannia clavigera kw1407]
MTSLVPRKPYTDEELGRLYPAGLQLQLVQVLMRHGERTPVSPRFENTGLQPFWPYCSAFRRFQSAVLTDDQDPGVVGGGAATQPLGSLAWRRRLETFGSDDAAVPATGGREGRGNHKDRQLDALCDMGMLTDPGRASTLRLGHRLRRLYVEQLGFLPPAIGPGDADRLFYLRSTPIPRALESLQQAFSGLYPETTRPQAGRDVKPITIIAREPADETLFPNDGNCRRFAELSRAFAQRAADRWNDSAELALVTRKIGRWLPPSNPRVAVDGRPRLSGIMDTVNATLAHGPDTRLPPEFYDDQVRHNITAVALQEWFDGFHESLEYRTLGIGGLMGDLVARMVRHAEIKNVAASASAPDNMFRFGLSGCHDTTLAAILASLGHRMDAWPPFTSHLALEMFHGPSSSSSPPPKPSAGWSALVPSALSGRQTAAPIGRKPSPELSDAQKQKLDGYYVRIRYNDEPVTIPGCRLPGNHLEGDESFCTLKAFKAIVDKYTPRNWKQQCHSNLRTQALPDKPEPSGF